MTNKPPFDQNDTVKSRHAARLAMIEDIVERAKDELTREAFANAFVSILRIVNRPESNVDNAAYYLKLFFERLEREPNVTFADLVSSAFEKIKPDSKSFIILDDELALALMAIVTAGFAIVIEQHATDLSAASRMDKWMGRLCDAIVETAQHLGVESMGDFQIEFRKRVVMKHRSR